jgi:hypothetical protein
MSQTELLMKEIETLPAACVGEVISFVSRLKHKVSFAENRTENPYEAVEELEGFGLACGSNLTLESFSERQKEDAELEEAQYRRLFRHEGVS